MGHDPVKRRQITHLLVPISDGTLSVYKQNISHVELRIKHTSLRSSLPWPNSAWEEVAGIGTALRRGQIQSHPSAAAAQRW